MRERPGAGDALLIEDAGFSSTIQDRGRFGFARFGISPAGAMDAWGLAIANALVGNPPGAAAIETTLSGPAFTVEAERCRLAVAGCAARVTLNGATVGPYRAFDARRDDRVAVSPGASGLRAYLAAAGGFDLPPALGSLSTHARSRLGGLDGRALRAGDRLPLAGTDPRGPCLALDEALWPRAGAVLRVLMGPQEDAFTPEGVAAFLGSPYRVSDRADRMGVQLDGPTIAHRGGFNIVSDGIVNGSIQVPGHGRPVVLMADRQTTGGYPKIATVIGPDLRLLAQARAGAEVRFVAVAAEEAERVAREDRRALERLVGALAPAGQGAPDLSSERLLGLNLVGGVVDGTDAG